MPSFPSPESTVSYSNDSDYFKDFETEFPAIVYNDSLTSKLDSLTEPASDKDNDDDELDIIWSSRAPFYVYIRDPVRRLCHRMISCSISGRGQVPEKVTGIDLFYLRIMERGTANVPYMLGQYLFRHAEGRKSGARLNICERLGDTWAWVAPGPERQPDDAVGAPEAARDVPAVDEGPPADPAPMHAPQPPHAGPKTMPQRIARLKRRCMSYGGALWDCVEILIDRSLIM
ncbi:hypothetical protein Tco_0862519 [Tanacetum coccineum]